MKRLIKISPIMLLIAAFAGPVKGQENVSTNMAANYLTITPDARAAALGCQGVATSPDASSAYWNASKYVFIDGKVGGSLSYTPWLRNITNDINLLNLSSYYKLDDKQAFSASIDYMSYGSAYIRNDFAEQMLTQHVGEFSISAGYSRLLAEGLSAGVNFRYIRALSGAYLQSPQYGGAFAADINAYYQRVSNIIMPDDELAFGLSLSNLGSKAGTSNTEKYFLPTTLRLGSRLTTMIDEQNKLMLAMEFSKLMVPRPVKNEDGSVENYLDKSALGAFFFSFGNSSFKEITWSGGAEYSYMNAFAVRFGYHYEYTGHGVKSQLGFGAGYTYKIASLDLSYTTSPNAALSNTLRVALSLNF